MLIADGERRGFVADPPQVAAQQPVLGEGQQLAEFRVVVVNPQSELPRLPALLGDLVRRLQEFGDLVDPGHSLQSRRAELFQIAAKLAQAAAGERAPVFGFRGGEVDVSPGLKVVGGEPLTTMRRVILHRAVQQ